MATPTNTSAAKPRQRLNAGVAEASAGRGGTIPPVEHRFKPGQSGNPGGQNKRPLTKILRELLTSENDRYAKEVVKAWVQLACRGHHTALKELLARVDGKTGTQETE